MPNLVQVNGILYELMATGLYKKAGVRTPKRFTLNKLKALGTAVAVSF